ncbi:MAG: hypothetical protein ACJARD_000421 [Alphaproteobacteria bacterium]|jgi:hypothetical protein
MSQNEIEFFYHAQCPVSNLDTATLRHHFNFSTHYMPTKFGRSTLRRADYITLNTSYEFCAPRAFVMVLYPYADVKLTLNNTEYPLKSQQSTLFLIPEGTQIHVSSTPAKADFVLFEYDMLVDPLTFVDHMVYDCYSEADKTRIDTLTIQSEYITDPNHKPFFAYILEGSLKVNDTKLAMHDAFYYQKPITLIGNAKILTFSMPIPL